LLKFLRILKGLLSRSPLSGVKGQSPCVLRKIGEHASGGRIPKNSKKTTAPFQRVHKAVKNGHLKKTPSYGRIEISTIGGIFMPRTYRHIEQYAEEILRLKAEGKTRAEIGTKLGFSKEQIHNFISRYNERQRKISAGIAIKKRGRPAKDSVATEEDKLADLRYKLARKDARIKQLEMENELMRDFLSLTERK
jgi:hypothetical protein